MENKFSSMQSKQFQPTSYNQRQLSLEKLTHKNIPVPVVNNTFPSMNNLMIFVSENLDVRGRYRLASTDNVSMSLAKCWHPACPAYLIISHNKNIQVSFRILKLQANHNHENKSLSDIQQSINSGYKLEQRISTCQQVFNQFELGNYFYNFLQSYKVINKEYKKKNEHNMEFLPYILPSICSQRVIPVTFKVFKAKFKHLKRLQLSILKTSIMEKDFAKLQSLHFLTGSREDNDLIIVMMVLAYSFLSNVKNPIIKLQQRIFQLIKEIQQKRKNKKKIQGIYERCIQKLLTLYQNHFNQDFQMIKFQTLSYQELSKLQNMHSKSEESYQVFSSKCKQPGAKVNKIRKWNVLINGIEKNRVTNIMESFGKRSQKFDDSKYIQIEDSQSDSKQEIKLCSIQKKDTSIIEDQIVGRYQTHEKNLQLQDLRARIKLQKQNAAADDQNGKLELIDMISLI